MRQRTIDSLDGHPNLTEILGVLAQLPHVTDADLIALAAAWHNTVPVADARSRALGADSPLILEVLATFDAVQALFAIDVAGGADYPTVDPAVATTALKAIRDAIAAAYARPVLRRADYAALIGAWHSVFPVQRHEEPDLGPQARRVKAVLAVLPFLAQRCHDEDAAGLFDRLHGLSLSLDSGMRDAARQEAWQAAVLTARRRVWELVRRSGMEGLGRFCPRCRRPAGGSAEVAVLELCLDAACALLVTDAVDETYVEILTLPLEELIPAPRGTHE